MDDPGIHDGPESAGAPEPGGATKFEWPVYREATLAGLAVLIPIPMVDLMFERIFRARIAPSIARYRKRKLTPTLRRVLRRRPMTFFGCLLLPFGLVLEFLKRLFRTLLYFLTVKSAADQLGHQWRRAFLIDRMLVRGDLDDDQSVRAVAAVRAFRQLIEEDDVSPLLSLAQRVLSSASHVLRLSFRMVRRKPRAKSGDQEGSASSGTDSKSAESDSEAQDARRRMEQGWVDVRGYFEGLGARYEKLQGAHWEALLTNLRPPDSSGRQPD